VAVKLLKIKSLKKLNFYFILFKKKHLVQAARMFCFTEKLSFSEDATFA
jgi:hypothetical protein